MRRLLTRPWNAQGKINPQEAVVAFEYFKKGGYPINTISGLIDACVSLIARLGVEQGIEMPESQDDATYILRQMGHNPSRASYAVYSQKGQPLLHESLQEITIGEEWARIDSLQARYMEEGMEEEEAFQRALKELGGK